MLMSYETQQMHLIILLLIYICYVCVHYLAQAHSTVHNYVTLYEFQFSSQQAVTALMGQTTVLWLLFLIQIHHLLSGASAAKISLMKDS